MQRREHLAWDLQHRGEQWSRLGECPPGISSTSWAYRFGGFGTHELVKYYDLVRELLWGCWEHLTELAQLPNVAQRPESMLPGDFLALAIPRLQDLREAWLDAPDPECHGRTPRSIVARERARLPEAVSGHEAMVDPDCPCCQMMADMPGPMFWHLDGSSMDDDFAFDIYCRTREEWDAEQREWEEQRRKFDAEWAERKLLGVAESKFDGTESPAIWSRSISAGDGPDVPLGIRVFGIGCRLAEVIAGLRGEATRESTPPETQGHIERLGRDFGNLRELLQDADPALAETLLPPVLQQFTATLENVATERPELAAQCESLADDLANLSNPPGSSSEWDADDSELPF